MFGFFSLSMLGILFGCVCDKYKKNKQKYSCSFNLKNFFFLNLQSNYKMFYLEFMRQTNEIRCEVGIHGFLFSLLFKKKKKT